MWVQEPPPQKKATWVSPPSETFTFHTFMVSLLVSLSAWTHSRFPCLSLLELQVCQYTWLQGFQIPQQQKQRLQDWQVILRLGGGKPWGKYLRWDGVGRLRGKHAAVVGSVVFSDAKNENKRKRNLWLLGRKRKKNEILNRYSWYNLQASSITDSVMPPEKHDHHQTQQYYCVD